MIPSRFQEAADLVLPDLRNRPDVLAIFLSGSFLQGKDGPTSDVVAQRPSHAYPALWRVVQQAVALRYGRARRWPAKDKWLLSDLEGWDSDLAAVLRAFYAEKDPTRLLALVERTLRLVLGPDDDLRIRSWESEPSLPPAGEHP